MIINKQLVEYVAELSKIKIEKNEIDVMCMELNKIIDYMNEINSSIDTDSVNECGFELTNVMRDDQVSVSMDRIELLTNAPSHSEETPVVPKTVR